MVLLFLQVASDTSSTDLHMALPWTGWCLWMCLKQQKQSSVALKVCKIHEVLGTVNWEIVSLARAEVLVPYAAWAAGSRSQQSQKFSSLVWRNCGCLIQIYKTQDAGTTLWVPLALGQTLAVHKAVKELIQCTSTLEWGKRAGRAFLRLQKTGTKWFKGRKQMYSSSFSFIPLTSISACKQDSFWSSHQQTCTFPEIHSSFRSWVTEDSIPVKPKCGALYCFLLSAWWVADLTYATSSVSSID